MSNKPPTPQTMPCTSIVLVEDNPSVATATLDLLQRAGYACASAASIQKALPLIRSRQPDLVVSDLHLEDGTAFDLLSSLDQEHCTVILIVVTAATEQDRQDVSNHPNTACVLTKPVSAQALLEAIREHIPARSEAPARTRHSIGIDERKQLLGES